MANALCEVLITDAPLEPQASDRNDSAGAVLDFWGVVRKVEDGREIDGIEYEAHRQMAEHQLKRIAEQTATEFGLEHIILHHRIGFIAVGEPSLFLRVCSTHRQEAFRASQWMINELKKKVPIWKKPRFKLKTQRHAAHPDAVGTTV